MSPSLRLNLIFPAMALFIFGHLRLLFCNTYNFSSLLASTATLAFKGVRGLVFSVFSQSARGLEFFVSFEWAGEVLH